MAGWAVSVVGRGHVNVGMGSLRTGLGGFLAMDYVLSK